jgi:crossover junction endodeoxyribonuclease RuvC
VRVLGVDPGLGTTGYAVVELNGGAAALREAGVVRTREALDLASRLSILYAELRAVVTELKPDLVALEDLFSSYRFPRSALKMAHARGVVCLAAAQSDLPVIDLAPAEVKNAVTGNGRASKQQVQRAIQQLYRLAATPEPPDLADAIAIATAGAYRAARLDVRDTPR